MPTKKTTTPTDDDRKSWPRIWSDYPDCLRWGKAADKAITALQKLVDLQEEFRVEYEKMSETDRATPRGDMLRTIIGFKVQPALANASEALNGVLYG